MHLDDLKERLNELKNTYVVVDDVQKCAICEEYFTQNDCVALTKDRERVHERCLPEKKDDVVVLKDMF